MWIFETIFIIVDFKMKLTKKPCVIDLFCGAGGLSHGFKIEGGYKLVAGIDIDKDCKYPYEENNQADFICKDIAELSGNEIKEMFDKNTPSILVGCAPCQPFSALTRIDKDARWNLVEHFLRIIKDVKPDIVSMENVPQILRFNKGVLFNNFVKEIKDEGYQVSYKIVNAADYGVPQYRKRLVLLASKHGEINLISPSHQPENYTSLKEAIGDLPPIKAGKANKIDPLHFSAGLSEINKKRIKASKPGGTWKDWPDELKLACHKKEKGKSFKSVYGKLEWKKPSTTLTTQFCGVGNGRYSHPSQTRALSLREGALIQSFPKDYKFLPDNQKIQKAKVARLIGNAVPVLLSQAIAKTIKEHLGTNYDG